MTDTLPPPLQLDDDWGEPKPPVIPAAKPKPAQPPPKPQRAAVEAKPERPIPPLAPARPSAAQRPAPGAGSYLVRAPTQPETPLQRAPLRAEPASEAEPPPTERSSARAEAAPVETPIELPPPPAAPDVVAGLEAPSASFAENSSAATFSFGSFETGASARSQSSGERLARSVCAFWMGSLCFGLDIELVGEVVQVESVLPVPLAPRAVLGLFNLRGTPVPVVDLNAVLELTEPREAPSGACSALVLRSDDLLAAIRIDRMEAVISSGRATLIRAEEGRDSPVVRGFVEIEGRPQPVVTLLQTQAVLSGLRSLRYV
ncbi:MAG: chemotaxis protein CheW [Polyangiaceae bacterium]